jgi:heme-degrading monooxygenase HmoA
MVEIFYRYRVHPLQKRAFEHAYGADGPWAKLFALHPGFKRTRLFRHKNESGVYVTVDVWASKADYDAFKRAYADQYRELDEQLALLKLEEAFLGFYEGAEEYHSSLDTHA